MITTYASGTLSTTGGGTEDFLSSPNVQGTFALQLDLNDMAAGDVIEVRAYKMVLTGGTQRVVAFTAYYGAQEAHKLIVIPFDPIFNSLTDSNAVRFSIKQTFGTAGISLPWTVLKDDALTPTTTARTLDVTATGAAGIDWGNVENPTTAVDLSATNIDVDQVVASVSGAVGSVTGNVGGNVAGSVGSVTGAVGSVTGNVGGNVTGSVGSVAAGGITAASIAAGAIDADALAADAVTEIVNAIIAIDVDGQDLQEALRIALAILGGKSSGLTDGYGTAVFRDIAGTKTRATVAISSDGNRTASTLDGT